MPVQRIRDIAEATAPVAEPLRPENLRAAFELSELCLRLHPRTLARGVRRYASIADAGREETSQADERG